jgi:glucose/arabinose dehydrogenase/cytochrome c553
MKVYIILIVLALTGFIMQCSVFNPSTKDFSGHSAAATEANYKNYCGGCHGEHMDAFVDRKWKHGSSNEALFHAIKKGYPDEGMPGFDTTFTDNEITNLVTYIKRGIENVQRYDFADKVTSNIFKTEELTIRLDTVAKGLQSPWGIAFLPDGAMLVTDKNGKLYQIDQYQKKQEIEGVPDVVAEGQGGLLDIQLHPDFKTNRLLYLSYSRPQKTDEGVLTTTAVTRAVLEGNKLTGQKLIFEALPYSRTRHHYGSRMEFGKDGYLYITMGDRGAEKENPQNLQRYAGKTHRIKDDGSIPADNPFVNTPGAVPSIFSYGHRNQQGMVMHPKTGAIWTHEHGPRGGDEINVVEKGKNYGWPAISYGINYNGTVLTKNSSAEGMEQPLLYWLPSIAPSGMAFVASDRYKDWDGNLLVGSLRFKYLNRCVIRGSKIVKQEILFKNIGRIRDVRMAPDGYVYISVENPGYVFRLTPVKG